MVKEEEVAEVEEVEVIDDDDDDSYRSSRSKRRSSSRDDEDDDEDEEDEERPSRLKAILGIIVVIIIILAIFLAYFFYWTPAKEIHLDPPQPDEDGIRVTCHVVMEGGNTADGDGDLEIFYDNERVYSDTIPIRRDDGLKLIDYDQFIIGNSDYTVKVTFRGKSNSETFNIQQSPFFWTVVEYVKVNAKPNPPEFNMTDQTNINLNVAVNIKDSDGNNPSAHAGKSKVDLKIKHESGSEQSYSKDVDDTFGVAFTYNYLSTGSGNYTYEVTWENLQVKSDSPHRTLEHTSPLDDNTYQNMNIVADAGEQFRTVTVGILAGQETEDFDARDSKNDGVITAYQWDFDFKDDNNDNEIDFTIDEVGEQVSYTYTTTADVGTTYTVALRVWGDGIFAYNAISGDPEYEFSFFLIEVTVKAGIS